VNKHLWIFGWALVAHTCDPTYSGGSNPAQANTLGVPILKNLSQK
jgi:hypothetical protein